MFAQAQLPDPHAYASIGWGCVILVAIIIGIRQGMGFIRDLKDKPSPAEVLQAASDRFAEKEILEEHIGETKRSFVALQEELKRDRHDNQIHASQRSAGLYKKIEETRENLEEKLGDLARDVQNAPDRILAILRNTGRLK